MHIRGIQKNSTGEPICKAGIEMQMQGMDLWTQQGKERVGRTERVALTYIHYRQLVGSCYIIQGAQPGAQWSMMTQRGRMGRWGWEGGSRGRGYMSVCVYIYIYIYMYIYIYICICVCIQLWLIQVVVLQKPTQQCKPPIKNFFLIIYFSIWLYQVLVAAHMFVSCGM